MAKLTQTLKTTTAVAIERTEAIREQIALSRELTERKLKDGLIG